jgi:TetR/AcrR family acrAB operon transcriptional repressor
VRYRKSEVSAAHIVAAATRVVARQGYAHTSLMDVAGEAGMSKGAVHYHFPTKEALMARVLADACDAVAERARAAWSAAATPDGAIRGSIRELWRMRAERTPEAAVVADLLAQSLHDAALRPALASFYRQAAGQLAEHLRSVASTLGVRPKLPMALLPRVLNGLLDGLVMQHFVDPDALDEQQVVSAIETIALSLFEPATEDSQTPFDRVAAPAELREQRETSGPTGSAAT